MKLNTIWKDTGIKKKTQAEIGESTRIIPYGASGWTLKKDDERRLEAAEIWCYRIMLRINCSEKRTNKSILGQLQTKRALQLPKLSLEKWLSLDRHAEQYVQTCKDMHYRNETGEKKMGRPSMQYLDNINRPKWTIGRKHKNN